MSTYEYCVDYSAGKLLRRAHAGEDLAWIRRLEDFRGTAEDARRAVESFEKLGADSKAEALRRLLEGAPT